MIKLACSLDAMMHWASVTQNTAIKAICVQSAWKASGAETVSLYQVNLIFRLLLMFQVFHLCCGQRSLGPSNHHLYRRDFLDRPSFQAKFRKETTTHDSYHPHDDNLLPSLLDY